MCQSFANWKLWYLLFLLYRICVAVFVVIYLFVINTNAVDSMNIWLFATLFVFVYVSILVMHYFGIINRLHGSIDRTVKEMMKNDMVKDVKELEMFGSKLNERKVSSYRHSNNESLWMRAFKSVNIENMKYLLSIDPNIDINEQNQQHGYNPLIYASVKNNIDAVNLLLNHPQIDVNQRDNDGCNALFHAIKNTRFEIAQLLLNSNADVNISSFSSGQTPIVYSTMKNQVDMIKLLVKQPQIDINHRDNDGNSALLHAVKNDHLETAQLLLESGSDVNVCDNDTGQTPLIAAINANNILMIKHLIKYHKMTGANINQRDSNDCNALYYAVQNEQLKTVHLLCSLGADVNIGDKTTGQSPLILAINANNESMVKYLIENKANRLNIDQCDNKGYSALFYAINNEHFEFAQLLVESGADANICDNNKGQTALMLVINANNESMIKYLIEHHKVNDVSINQQDSNGCNSFYYAVQNNQFETMHLLCGLGANVNTQHKVTGQTPLMVAFSHKNHQTITWMLQRGEKYSLDTSTKDKSKETAWVYCWKTKNYDWMIEYINYHKNTKICDWNIQELDCNGSNNALTWNFSNIFEPDELNSQQQITLFTCLIDGFLNNDRKSECETILWPKSADNTMLTWLWNQLKFDESNNCNSECIQLFPIVLEAIAKMLHNIDNSGSKRSYSDIDFQVINEINQLRWICFFQTFNSVKCITYFVKSIINPNNPVKIDNINQINRRCNDDTILLVFAKQTMTKENKESMKNKFDPIIAWLNHEYSVSSGAVKEFINFKDRIFDESAIAHAILNRNYYFAKAILQNFGQYLELTSISDKFNSPWLRIIESKKIDLIQLAVAAMISINQDDHRLNIINEKSTHQGIIGITPLFWAANNQFYELLHLMLQSENINLHPTVTDHSGNTIWEYVTGLVITAIKNKFEYRVDNIDITSMKLLIEKQTINVNKCDPLGNQAWYRICGAKYHIKSKKSTNVFGTMHIFNKQYDAIKLLLENGAKIDIDPKVVKNVNKSETNANLHVWKKIMLLVQNNKLQFANKSSVRNHIINELSVL